MKNAFKLMSVALVAAFVLASCGKSTSPKEVADNFFTALSSKKFDDANKLATAEGIQAVNNFKDFVASDSTVKYEFKAAEPTVTGDSATVKYTVNGAEKTAKLKKVEGEWRIEVTVEDLLGEAGEMQETPMEPAPADTAKTAPVAEEPKKEEAKK